MAAKKALNSGVIFESTDPLTSRERFKSRTFLNMVVIAGIFIAVVTVLSVLMAFLFPGFFGMLMVDALAIAGAYYFYILWDKRPIRLRCEKCRKLILSNTPWVCGFCKVPNRNANEYPFIDRCGHCGDEPKAYKCHHCGELIFLAEDRLEPNYAYCLNSPDEMPKPDERAEKKNKVAEEKQEKQDKIELALLDERLRTIRKRIRGEKKKSAREILVTDFGSAIELDEAERELKADNAKKYTGEKLERMDAAVDDAVRRQLAGN